MPKITYLIVFTFLSMTIANPARASIPDLRRDGNAYPRTIATQSGNQLFMANEGFVTGSNYTKIFGENQPTTLWDDDRRIECYEHSIRLMAQMPVAGELQTEGQAQGILQDLGLGATALKYTAQALNHFHTNYVSGGTVSGQISNLISNNLRGLNPKTIGRVSVPCTNLKHLGNLLQHVEIAAKAADFAVGAAIQEALAGDLALGRLQLLETALRNRQSAGVPVDPAIFEAIRRARSNLERSEDYWGALITELTDRSSELVKMTFKAGVEEVGRDSVKLLAKYYAKHAGLGAKAATKASSVAGLWAFSLIATYETIDSLLDQHEKAQVAVTSAALAHILQDEMDQGRIPDAPIWGALGSQAGYSYYDQMVKASSGKLSFFRDLLSVGHPYKDVKDHFTIVREKTRKEILQQVALTLPSAAPGNIITAQQPGPAPQAIHPGGVPGGRSILIILDTSGSMKDPLEGTRERKIDGAKRAVLGFLDTTGGPAEWALMVYEECVPKILVDFTEDAVRIRDALAGIEARGATPVAASLVMAGDYLKNHGRYITCDVVLLSDGEETCKGDPVQAARDLYGQSIDFTKWMRP